MGLFDSILKPLTGILDTGKKVITGDFKGLGTSDLFNVAGLAAGGGNPFNFSSYGTSNIAKNLGQLNTSDLLTVLMGNSSVPGRPGSAQTPQGLQGIYDQLAGAEAGFSLANINKRFGALDRAYNALSDENAINQGVRTASGFLRDAGQEGRSQANALIRRGYASSVGDAAQLDARNRAVGQGNELQANLNSPNARASRALAQSQVYPQSNGLGSLMAIQTQRNNQRISDLQYESMKPPSDFENVLPVLGTILAQYGDDIFGKKKEAPSQKVAPKQSGASFRKG